MIYQELTRSDFRDAFISAGHKDNFSYEALGVLYDFYNELGQDYELDVIAVCCEWTEYESLEDACNDYFVDYDESDIDFDEEDIFNELSTSDLVDCAIKLDNGNILILN